MRRPAMLAPAALALLLAAGPAGAWAVEVAVRPADGPERSGRLGELNSKSLTVYSSTGGTERYALADLMAVEFPEAKAPEGADCAHLHLVSGDVIPARVEVGEGDKLLASGPWVEKFPVKTRELAALVMPAALKDKEILKDVLAALRRPGRRHDTVFLPNGDLSEGSFEGLTRNGLRLKSSLGPQLQEFKLADVAAVVFAELRPWSPPEDMYFVAEMAGGGRVSGSPVSLAGDGLEWKTLSGARLKLTASTVGAIRVRNGRVTFLSEAQPSAVDETPFVEGLPFVWKWRADRDVFGKPLVLGGVAFGRGLGVAAGTRLTYELDGKYRRFKAAAGVCDSAAPGGKTAFKVLVDDKEVFSANPLLTRGARPVPVDVSVEKAAKLTLVIDFGDGSDLGDIGGWGDARVIK
jgi:hypothetical protein